MAWSHSNIRHGEFRQTRRPTAQCRPVCSSSTDSLPTNSGFSLLICRFQALASWNAKMAPIGLLRIEYSCCVLGDAWESSQHGSISAPASLHRNEIQWATADLGMPTAVWGEHRSGGGQSHPLRWQQPDLLRPFSMSYGRSGQCCAGSGLTSPRNGMGQLRSSRPRPAHVS
jgi:hypothetical protein